MQKLEENVEQMQMDKTRIGGWDKKKGDPAVLKLCDKTKTRSRTSDEDNESPLSFPAERKTDSSVQLTQPLHNSQSSVSDTTLVLQPSQW
jgi:hypothetical protein